MPAPPPRERKHRRKCCKLGPSEPNHCPMRRNAPETRAPHLPRTPKPRVGEAPPPTRPRGQIICLRVCPARTPIANDFLIGRSPQPARLCVVNGARFANQLACYRGHIGPASTYFVPSTVSLLVSSARATSFNGKIFQPISTESTLRVVVRPKNVLQTSLKRSSSASHVFARYIKRGRQ